MLTLDQARDAFAVGLARYDHARRLGLINPRDCHGGPRRARRHDGWAALAECMVAERLGRVWLARVFVGRKDDGEDVEGGLQVKWTQYWHGKLAVKATDRRDLLYVLVVGNCWPGLAIRGWSTFARATWPAYWRDDVTHPAYFAPQGVLQPVELLEMPPT